MPKFNFKDKYLRLQPRHFVRMEAGANLMKMLLGKKTSAPFSLAGVKVRNNLKQYPRRLQGSTRPRQQRAAKQAMDWMHLSAELFHSGSWPYQNDYIQASLGHKKSANKKCLPVSIPAGAAWFLQQSQHDRQGQPQHISTSGRAGAGS